jgi:hypothetical protein
VGTHAQEQLALLCARLSAETGPLVTDGSMRALATSIAEQIRAGADPADLADVFDELDDLLLRAGYAAGLGSYRTGDPSFTRLPGVGDGHPVLEVLACPGNRCARVELPDGKQLCPVFGKPLGRIRLRP